MKSFCLILVVALSLPACARFSESARRQRAYEKYVHKSMKMRNRRMTHVPHKRTPEVPPLDMGRWQATTTAETGQPVESVQTDH